MTQLRLSRELALPLEAITETIAILGIRGSGKTNTAAVYAEELLKNGQQVVIIDPTDAWWGLKSSADGQSPGFPVVVLGGKHADLPLNSGDGKLIADFVVEEHASVICSLRHFESKNQELSFATAFLRRLYHLKGQQDNPTPLALYIDEASRLVPQRVMGEDAACVGAVQQIVRQGRSSGFGVVLIDQRAATVNKDVLAQLEMMIVHRTNGPQDRKALKEWIEAHDTEGREKEFLSSIASLPQGDAWFWSPGWLDLFTKVHVRQRETFDSSRTPRAGEVVVAPKRIAEVDLEALRGKLSATLEKAKADDPKELRKRIIDLERELRHGQKVDTASLKALREDAFKVADFEYAETIKTLRSALEAAMQFIINVTTKNFDVAGVGAAEIESAIRSAVSAATGMVDSKLSAKAKEMDQLRLEAQRLADRVKRVLDEDKEPVVIDVAVTRNEPFTVAPRASSNGNGKHAPPPKRAAVKHEPRGDLKAGQRKILNALAELEAIGIDQASRPQLGMVAGYNLTGGTGGQHIADLVSLGLAELPDKGSVRLTDAGRAAADPAAAPTSLQELHERVLRKLSSGQRKIAEHLIRIYPEEISRAELGAATGYNLTGGTGGQHVADLVTVGVAKLPGSGRVVASDLLFPDGLR